MQKRTIESLESDGESLVQVGDSNEQNVTQLDSKDAILIIEQSPPTKIIRIDDSESNSIDKCIQVGSSFLEPSTLNIEELDAPLVIDVSSEDGSNVVELPVRFDDQNHENEIVPGEDSNEEEKDDDFDADYLDDEESFVDSNGSSYSPQEGESSEMTSEESDNELADTTEMDSTASQPLHSIPDPTVHLSDKQPSRSVLKSPGQRSPAKKNVKFVSVSVYIFRRSQGFTCVPSVGGSTLGMDKKHMKLLEFTIDSFVQEKLRNHREFLYEQKRVEKASQNSSESEENSLENVSDISESDLEEEQISFCQPLPLRQRRELLRASGVTKILQSEKIECQNIRRSREQCGCQCFGECLPDRCSCALSGIGCQVDRFTYPCGCTSTGCRNANGRIEFNPERVKTHLLKTLQRVNAEFQTNPLIGQTSPSETSSVSGPSCSQYPTASSSSLTSDCIDSAYLPQQEASLYAPSISNPLHEEQQPEPSCSEESEDCLEDLADDYNLECSTYPDQCGNVQVDELSQQQQEQLEVEQAGGDVASSNATVLPPFISLSGGCDLMPSLLSSSSCVSQYDNSLTVFESFMPVLENPAISSTPMFYSTSPPSSSDSSSLVGYSSEAGLENDSSSLNNNSLIQPEKEEDCANDSSIAESEEPQDYADLEYPSSSISIH